MAMCPACLPAGWTKPAPRQRGRPRRARQVRRHVVAGSVRSLDLGPCAACRAGLSRRASGVRLQSVNMQTPCVPACSTGEAGSGQAERPKSALGRAASKVASVASAVLGGPGGVTGTGGGGGDQSPAAQAAHLLGADSVNVTVDAVQGWLKSPHRKEDAKMVGGHRASHALACVHCPASQLIITAPPYSYNWPPAAPRARCRWGPWCGRWCNSSKRRRVRPVCVFFWLVSVTSAVPAPAWRPSVVPPTPKPACELH